MRILVLLYIQKACNKMPPNHGFYCCWAPNRYEQKVHFVCSPHMAARLDWRCTGGAREVDGRWTGGGREVHGRWTGVGQVGTSVCNSFRNWRKQALY